MAQDYIVTKGAGRRKMVFSHFIFPHWEGAGSASYLWKGPKEDAEKLAANVGGRVEAIKRRER
jgi:hypothetical protein